MGSMSLGMPTVLLPESGDNFTWEVTFDGTDSYTLRNAMTRSYLGDAITEPEPLMMLRGSPAPWAWKIERGAEPETFTLSPKSSNGSLRLGPSPVRAYPPSVGSVLATDSPDQLWRLVKV
ncbi:hypothetical protein WMF37_19560 [Sorangium sp. So ce291]|uniref:hypothetical protein n=1 Tax=Sorangium sp. So ce291 TaxID=3133294 RepID=UPI003F6162F8